jgi:hypothetical protein
VAELDDQLARLAAQRAAAVPPLDPAAARLRARRNARRRAAWVGGIAACIVALLAAGGFALAGGSDDSPSVHTPANSTEAPAPTTAPPTTAPPTTAAPTTTVPVVPACEPLDGADAQAKTDESTATTALPVFVGVQVEASDCADVVLLEFGNGTPAWSAAYEPSPTGAGEGVLVLRFTSDITVSGEPEPSELLPGEPSRILGVRGIPQVDGSDPVSIFPMSQGSQRAFRAVVLEDALAIEITRIEGTVAAKSPVVCQPADQHVQYDVPAGWYVDVTPDQLPCTRVAPQPFAVCNACDGPFPWGSIGVSPNYTSDVGPSSVLVSSTETTVGGRAATLEEVEATGDGLFTAGYRTHRYVVDWAPQGTLLLSIGGMPSPEYDARKAGLDTIAASVRGLD